MRQLGALFLLNLGVCPFFAICLTFPFEWALLVKLYMLFFTLLQVVISKEVQWMLVTLFKHRAHYIHPSIAKNVLDPGHGCVDDNLETKYERDTGPKSENTFICHFTLHSFSYPISPTT